MTSTSMKKTSHAALTMRLACCLALSLCAVLPAAARADGDLVLVSEGKSQCVIVASDGLSPSEKTAVAELQKYFTEMSGVEKIPVMTPSAAAAAPAHSRIVVGNKTVRELYPNVSLDGLGTDGFILKSDGNSLLVAGGEKRGTMYAAFDLLERLGVRWWAVAVDGTYVPKKPNLSVAPLDVRQIPKLEYRDMLYSYPYLGEVNTRSAFFAHNKVNGFFYGKNKEEWGGVVEFDGLAHTWAALMQPVDGMDGSFAAHPEYWALRNGKRTSAQVCTMEPMVYEIMKANVFKKFREHPNYEFVAVSQEDNSNYCQCEKCSALAAEQGSQAAPGLLLVNKIAEAVEKEFPGKKVLGTAYTWTRKPPLTIKPRDNVIIELSTIECDFNRPLEDQSTNENKLFAEDIVAWGKIAKTLYIWDYTTNFNHYLMPFPNLDAMVSNIRFFVKHGVKGICEQGSHTVQSGEFDTLRMWVLAKALWDPEKADGPALIKEFVEGFYGAAAPYILKYIDVMHSPGRADPGMAMGCYPQLDSSWLSPEVIADSEVVLQKAEEAVADDPVLLSRVRHAHLPILYILLKRGPQSKTWAATLAKSPSLTFPQVSTAFTDIVLERDIQAIAEGEDIETFGYWVTDYAALTAKETPLPPELKGADPAKYRLIQACQMDARARGWDEVEGASDGWACEIPTEGWNVFHQFSPFDDVTPGKTYKLTLRVKADKPSQGDESAFICGVFTKPSAGAEVTYDLKSVSVPANTLADGKFHAVDVGEFVANGRGQRFWIALKNAVDPRVYLDCLWLQEVEK